MQALVINGRQYTDTRFNNQITNLYKYSTTPRVLPVHPRALQRMIPKYSEQLTYKPLTEIEVWSAKSVAQSVDKGYLPYFYEPKITKNRTANSAAVFAVAEGVAGLIAQQIYRGAFLSRPYYDFPDAILYETDLEGAMILVEAKGTSQRGSIGRTHIKSEVKSTIKDLAKVLISCKTSNNDPLYGLIIGTHINTPSSYDCYITRLNI